MVGTTCVHAEVGRNTNDVTDAERHLMKGISKMDTISKYNTPGKRKKLIETEFAKVSNLLNSLNRENYRLNKRKKALLTFMEEAEKRYRDYNLESVQESFIRLELVSLHSYTDVMKSEDTTLASALWILDDLRRSGKMLDAYEYLPSFTEDISDTSIPVDFYHPCYSPDLIQSVVHTISPQNFDSEGFRGLIKLLNKENVNKAVEKFKALQWDVINRYMRGEEYFCKKFIVLQKQLDQQNMSSALLNQFSNQEVKAPMVSPLIVPSTPIQVKNKKINLTEEIDANKRNRIRFTGEIELLLGTDERTVFGIRELGRIIRGFRIDNPYDICFALTYMLGTDDPAIWLTKASLSVILPATRLLPWYWDINNYDHISDEWFRGMQLNRNGWLDKKPPSEKIDLYHDGYPNTAQRIYRLCRGVLPVGFHPFEKERQQMKADGVENADFIADWSELLFLSGFRAEALNLHHFSWDEDDEDDEDEEIPTTETAKNTKLGGYWGKIAGVQQDEKADKANFESIDALKAELVRAKKEIKGLRKKLAETSRNAETERSKTAQELKTLRQEHRELSDLRELVFNKQLDNPNLIEKVENDINYPYETKKRTVIFGGHDTFLKAIKPMLPSVRFVDSDNMSFNPEIVRNADVVWIQNNCISHPMYWSVVKNCKIYGVQLRYFAYASAEKCAEQLVIEDRKI